MVTLLAVVTGDPSKDQGRDLYHAMPTSTSPGAFDRVLRHMQATPQDLEVWPEDQRAILAAMQARRRGRDLQES
jgi:hypothetical protein